MAVAAVARCVSARALLDLKSNHPATVREITAFSGEAGAGAWIRPLGSEPIQIGPGAPATIDVTSEITRQFPSSGQPQSYNLHLDISSEPKQDIQRGLYRLNLAANGSVTKFENYP
jgi:hypothetical protein